MIPSRIPIPPVLDALQANLFSLSVGGAIVLGILAGSDRILAHVAEVYFPHFAVVAWIEDVEVVRGDKYA